MCLRTFRAGIEKVLPYFHTFLKVRKWGTYTALVERDSRHPHMITTRVEDGRNILFWDDDGKNVEIARAYGVNADVNTDFDIYKNKTEALTSSQR